MLFSLTIISAYIELHYKYIKEKNRSNNTKQIESLNSDDKHESITIKVLTSFSIISNTKALFKQSPDNFANIDSIRLLVLLVIILIHNYYGYVMWNGTAFVKRMFTGLPSKIISSYKYTFIRNIHNTDFFFMLR